MPVTIIVEAAPNESRQNRRSLATATVQPGMLLDSGPDGVEPFDIAGGIAERLFSIESSRDELNTEITTGNIVLHRVFQRGDIIYARLAAEESASAGDKLEPAGDGALRPIPAAESEEFDQAGSFIGTAQEDVDNSSGISSVLIKIRVA